MKTNQKRVGWFGPKVGFLRKELLFVLIALLGILAAGISWVEVTKSKARIFQCQNNLVTMYTGLTEVRDSNKGLFPWRQRAVWDQMRPKNEPTVWYFAATASNYIRNPKILTCPADSRAPANDWSANSEGLANANFQDNAVSYFVGVDASLPRSNPRVLLLGDRNIIFKGRSGCYSLLGLEAVVLDTMNAGKARNGWVSTNLHKTVGNVVNLGGEVSLLNSMEFENIVTSTADGDDAYDTHYLLPEGSRVADKSRE